jgi:xylose dehydrogenase (NAD/NADP)
MRVAEHFERFTRRDWQDREEGGPIRFAVVGLGGFSRERALPAIERSTFCTVTTLVSGSAGKLDTVAAEFDADHAIDYEAFTSGVAVDAYDAVYVATPPAFHLEYVETAAESGKHVLCEKPLATDPERARRMIDRCEANGVTLMTAYRLQTEPAVRRLREVIADGCIGDPVQAHGGFSVRLLESVGADTWRLDPAVAGGGALIDVGIYPLNTLRYLLDRDPVAVRGELTSGHEAFDRVEEHVAFQLSLPDGITASCTASFNAHETSQLQILGTEGQVRITAPFGGEVPQEVLVESGDVGTEHVGEPVDEVVEEFDYFAHCIMTGETPEPDGADGLTDLEAIDAIYEAAESGRTVEIDSSVP